MAVYCIRGTGYNAHADSSSYIVCYVCTWTTSIIVNDTCIMWLSSPVIRQDRTHKISPSLHLSEWHPLLDSAMRLLGTLHSEQDVHGDGFKKQRTKWQSDWWVQSVQGSLGSATPIPTLFMMNFNVPYAIMLAIWCHTFLFHYLESVYLEATGMYGPAHSVAHISHSNTHHM